MEGLRDALVVETMSNAVRMFQKSHLKRLAVDA